jgi:hypothetical protein
VKTTSLVTKTKCRTCNQYCQACTAGGIDHCSQCMPGHFLEKTSCVQRCSGNLWPNDKTNPRNPICDTCSFPCVTCRGGASYCTSCSFGYYLVGKGCFKCDQTCITCETAATNCLSCPKGKFLVQSPMGNLCTGCRSQACLDCSSPTVCTKCNQETILYNGDCFVTCPNGLYEIISTRQCVKECPPGQFAIHSKK